MLTEQIFAYPLPKKKKVPFTVILFNIMKGGEGIGLHINMFPFNKLTSPNLFETMFSLITTTFYSLSFFLMFLISFHFLPFNKD